MSVHTWPFDSAVIGSVTVSAHDVVPGTPEFSVSGSDASQDLDDGTILFYRISTRQTAFFSSYGDRRSLATAAGSAVTVSLYDGYSLFRSFRAAVKTEYQESENRTLVTLEES